MDISILLCSVFILAYIGAVIYMANQDEVARRVPQPAASSPFYGNRDIEQRRTILRWTLYGILTINLVYALLVLQIGLLSDSPAVLAQLDVEVPPVDRTAALVNFVIALSVSVVSFRVVSSAQARQLVRRLVGGNGLYDPDSQVHTTAVVLCLTFLSMTIGQLVITGGLSGLAQEIALDGVSLTGLLFQTVLMTATAFLGVGLAIRRSLSQSLERLGLRLPTMQDVLWGAGVGAGLYVVFILMALIWSSFVPIEQIEEQSAAAEEIAQAFGTLPLALLLSMTAAVSEEIFFRGALQPIFGLWLTSLFFALAHMQYTLTPATIIIFVVALGVGWLRGRQSTTAAIIAHFVYNFVQLAAAILLANATGGV